MKQNNSEDAENKTEGSLRAGEEGEEGGGIVKVGEKS